MNSKLDYGKMLIETLVRLTLVGPVACMLILSPASYPNKQNRQKIRALVRSALGRKSIEEMWWAQFESSHPDQIYGHLQLVIVSAFSY